MKTVDKENYELPLFDGQLLRLTFSPEGLVDDPEGREEDIESGTLYLKETVASMGRRSISVIHKHDGERVSRYRFEVMDSDQRICRYAGSGNPPWSIYGAVTEYGYHCQTAPKSERKYAFDLLHAGSLELLQRVIELEFEYSEGWGTRLFRMLQWYIRLAALEYQIGSEHMEEAASILGEQRGNDPAESIFENWQRIFEEYDVENAFIPHSIRHPSTKSLQSNNADADCQNDKPKNESQSEAENPFWSISKHRGRGDYEKVLFVSIIGSDAIDRFSFQITDEEAGECVAQTNLVGDLPPYSVIESVQEEFSITNIPSFTYSREDMPYSQFLIDLDRVVRRTTKQISPESDPTESMLDDYIVTLEVYLTVVAAYEIAPEEYNRGVTKAFSELGIDLSTQNIGKLSHNHLDQISLIAFQSVDDANEIKMLARELMAATNVQDRRRVDVTEEPDATLAAQLLDKNPSIHK